MDAAPDPTRSTTRLNWLNGNGVDDGVRVCVGVVVGVTAGEGVWDGVRALVRELLGVDAGVCDADPEGDPDAVLEGVVVGERVVDGVPVGTLVVEGVPVDAPVDDEDAVPDGELLDVATEVPVEDGSAP